MFRGPEGVRRDARPHWARASPRADDRLRARLRPLALPAAELDAQAGSSGEGALQAISPAIGPWEVFRLEWPSADTVRIRIHTGALVYANERDFLSPGDGQGPDDPRALFGLIWHGDDRVTFKASNGHYVCAEPEGAKGTLFANRRAIGEWEKFLLEEPPPL